MGHPKFMAGQGWGTRVRAFPGPRFGTWATQSYRLARPGPPAHWQNGKMVIRWLASAFIRTEKRFNKIMGYRDLWTLETILNDTQPASGQVAA